MLHTEAQEVVENIWTQQKPEIEIKIQGVGGGKKAVEYMASKAVESVWRATEIGKLNGACDLVSAVPANEGKWKILFTDVGSDTETVVKGDDTVKVVVEMCR